MKLSNSLLLLIGFLTISSCSSPKSEENNTEIVDETRSVPTFGIVAGRHWVDMGTSVMWSICNVGATSATDAGGYYAWGETENKRTYSERTSSMMNIRLGDISGDPQLDVARVKWGDTWRLPTKDEFQELIDNCTWEFENNTMKITADNGNVLYFPLGGLQVGAATYEAGTLGGYWTSSSDDPKEAYLAAFAVGNSPRIGSFDRFMGLCVRPVIDK